MELLVLTQQETGREIYLNPALIVGIEKSETGPGTKIQFRGYLYTARETPGQVLEMINLVAEKVGDSFDNKMF